MPAVRRRFTQAQLRQGYWDYLRRNAWGLAGVALLFASAASSAWLLGSSEFERGLIVGFLGTSLVAMTLLAYLAFGGGMSWFLGSAGEEYTRECLQGAVKRRQVWGWVDNIELEGGDIDHAVVAPVIGTPECRVRAPQGPP